MKFRCKNVGRKKVREMNFLEAPTAKYHEKEGNQQRTERVEQRVRKKVRRVEHPGRKCVSEGK